MSTVWTTLFDASGLVECVALYWTLLSIFEWKYSRKKTLCAAVLSGALFFVCNTAVIVAEELYGMMDIRVRFWTYMLLMVGTSFFFSYLCLKGFWQQFLVTILFFKSYILLASVLYKQFSGLWADLLHSELGGWVLSLLLSVLVAFLSAVLCKKVTHPLRTRISPVYWSIACAVPLMLYVLWQLISQQTDGTVPLSLGGASAWQMLLVNLLLFALSFACYILFALLANEMEKQTELQLANQTLAFQMRQMDDVQALLEQTRTARHELKNNYFYLETLLQQGNYEEMERLLTQVIWPQFEKQELVATGNRLVDMILSQKVMDAKQRGIPIVLDVLLPSELAIQPQMLCSLLFNLLDNAIEASQAVEQPDIFCGMHQKKGYLSILVRNRIDRSVLGPNPALHTSKPDKANHGIGMKLVRQVVDHCDGSLEISEEDGWFVVQVLLPQQSEMP